MNVDFFVSYTAVDRPWAQWIAATLEGAGYTTIIQAWDFRPGQDFAQRMRQAADEATRTIAVVSRSSCRSGYVLWEWKQAVEKDPTGLLGTLVPVRVDDVVPDAFATVIWIDLVGAMPEEAAARLLEGVQLQRVKPSGSVRLPDGTRPRFPGALPPIWQVPYDRNPVFTGRDDLLEELRTALGETRSRPTVAALTGTGGVGKTATVVEHCYRAMADYQVVWWARAARREFAEADLAALAEPLGLRKDAHTDTEDLAAVRRWLGHHDQWLLILDEAEHAETIRGLIPQGGSGHVLVTSRDPAWRRDASFVREVQVLEADASAKLLARRTGLAIDRATNALADALGHLPLALELVGAFVERQGIGFHDYLQRLKRAGGVPDAVSGTPPDYHHTLRTVWSESVAVLAQREPAVVDLLRLCAYLAPDDLPREVLKVGAGRLPVRLQALAHKEETLQDLIALPRSFSLVATHGDGLSLHRLLQAIVRDELDEKDRCCWAGAAVAMMRYVFPQQAGDTRLWQRSGRLLPHAASAADHAEELAVEPEATFWLLDRAATYSGVAEPGDAREGAYRVRALAIAERALGSDQVPAWLLNNHGQWLLGCGNIQAARLLLERVIAGEERAHGTSASLGTYCMNLADLELRERHPEVALALLRRATACLDRYVEHPHPNVALAHSKLGQLLIQREEMQEAERELRRAVELYEATLGPSALDTLFARSLLEGVRAAGRVPKPWFAVEQISLATIERNEGKALIGEPAYADETEECLRRAVAAGDAAANFHLWQHLERKPGRKNEAAAMLERAVAAGVPQALYWRGRQLVDVPGQEAEAERTIRAALGVGQPYAWYDLGLLLERDPARQDEAEAAFRAALDAGHEEARNELGLLLLKDPLRQADGEAALQETGRRGHARGYHNLGHHLATHGREVEAMDAFRAAIAGGYLASHVDLGILLDKAGRRTEAEREFQAAMEAHQPCGAMNLGVLLEMDGRPVEAEQAYRAAVAAGAEGAYNRLGNLIARQPGREQDAVAVFAEQARAGDPQGWLSLAGLAMDMHGNETFAEEAYRNAISAGLVVAWNNLGILLAELPGRAADAEAAFIEAIRTGHRQGWRNLGIHLSAQPGRETDAARATALADQGAGPAALEGWTGS